MTHSSSTAPGTSDAQSTDSNGPLSLDALFSAELSGGEPADPAKNGENDENGAVAAPPPPRGLRPSRLLRLPRGP